MEILGYLFLAVFIVIGSVFLMAKVVSPVLKKMYENK